MPESAKELQNQRRAGIGKVEHSEDGLEMIVFTDANGKECSLRQANPKRVCLLLGNPDVAGAEPQQLSLTHLQVHQLLNTLNQWLRTDSFRK
jgi:hypothetical protein